VTKKLVALALATLVLSGCSNLTRQQQRALSGGAIGAAGGAAVAAVAGGPILAGAVIGAGAGAVIGAVTH
jgi:osmotically inducible lipoprotein OsmB